MIYFVILAVNKSGGETATQDHDPCLPINLLQECLDEVKQNLQGISITSTSNEAVDTLSNLSVRRQKKIQHNDAFVEEEKLNSDIIDDDDTSSKERPILTQSSNFFPRIYRATNDPSVDDQDGEVWRYGETNVTAHFII